eukprot:TRINITY_DN16902_c0_g1_i1.p1 TRINITY_DN16902_c0_g1~~TRINITY_DN16902_c0_g1_i1.p1  ORF type:complete len:291 (-),score=26.25 TRINITY_DN16902_c0_g1_i1:54-926(-)
MGNTASAPANEAPSEQPEGAAQHGIYLGDHRISEAQTLGSEDPEHTPASVQHTTTIRAHVNLLKSSVKLECTDGKYGLKFNFDTSCPVKIGVYWVAREVASRSSNTCKFLCKNKNQQPIIDSAPKKLNQVFEQKKDDLINPEPFASSDLVWKPGGNFVPIIIVLQSDVETGPLSTHPQTLVTYCTLTKGDSEEFTGVRVLKQKMQINGVSYMLQDIFGVDPDDETGRDCVICLVEPRNTAVLPCRHMCLCTDCADVIRHQSNKCPICRQPVQSLLQITKKQPSVPEEEEE